MFDFALLNIETRETRFNCSGFSTSTEAFQQSIGIMSKAYKINLCTTKAVTVERTNKHRANFIGFISTACALSPAVFSA